MRPYLIVFAVAAAVSFVTTPLVRRIGARFAMAVPSDRKVHREPTPQLGGVAMYLGFLAALGVAWLLPEFRSLFKESTEPVGVLGGATVVLILGAVDDMRDLRATTKLAGHILAATVAVLGGLQILYFWLPGVGVLSLSTDLSALITVMWTIAVINAVNLIDGLDGLACGVVAIASISFFVYAFQTTSGFQTTSELITAIVAGATLGFLKHNFAPARIFMGDAGAYLLGLLLASATVSGISRTTEPKFVDVAGFVVPVLLPFLVLAIPLADASLAIVRRMKGRQPVFHADKNHIHHWLYEMAQSHRKAVLVMYMWSAMLASAALVLALGPGVGYRIVSGAIAFAMVLTIVILPRIFRRGTAATGDAARNEGGVGAPIG